MEAIGIDHDYLIKKAVRWLQKRQRCYVVIADLQTVNEYERPDAIGFQAGGFSVLVECKVSRSDFFRDKKKGPRRMGGWRYYMVPHGLIAQEEVPDEWGLVYVRDGKCRIVKNTGAWGSKTRATEREVRLLVDALRRVPHPCVHIRR